LQEALSHNVESAVLHTSMGDCHIRLQHYIDAKNEYDKALEIDEEFAEAWSGLGYVHSDTGNSQKALSCFQKAYSLEPYNDSHLFNLASEYWKINKKEKALECLLEVEKKQPNDPDLYFSLGELLADMDRYDEAFCYLQLGLQRTNNDPTLRYLLAYLHLEKGHRQLALGYLEGALEDCPSYYKEFLEYNPEMLTNDVEIMEMVERKVRSEE
ncbi:MAG: tetratricopeptide repeat protein, partial [Paludibacteraceae bacterium]|nr:tetratricopeptide repeat protein [Paludibacteraceae bacterium]